jgi:hypothetical protein
MNLLFIKSIVDKDWTRLETLSYVLIILYSCVLLALLIDLFFGVRRAKRLKVARTSYGFRRTITKATTYFGLMMLLSIADVVASIIFQMPYFTVVGALGIVIVEGISVYEKVKDENKKIEEVPTVLLELLKNKDNIQDILSWLKQNEDKKNDSETIYSEFSTGFHQGGE